MREVGSGLDHGRGSQVLTKEYYNNACVELAYITWLAPTLTRLTNRRYVRERLERRSEVEDQEILC